MVKISVTIEAGIGMIVVMLIMLSTIGVVVSQVDTVSAEAVNWTFTGHEAAETLLGFVPFGWIAGIVIFAITGAFLLAQGLRGGQKM